MLCEVDFYFEILQSSQGLKAGLPIWQAYGVSVRSIAIPMENIPSHPDYKALGRIICGFHIAECVRFPLHQAGFSNKGDGVGRSELR